MQAPLTPHTLWSAWTFEPSILIPLTLSILIYIGGVLNIWQHAGAGRGINKRHYVSFLGALLSLFVAFISPLDALSEVLFSAHMVQHLILILVTAPLLVMSDFPLAFLWILPRASAQRLGYWWNRSKTFSRIWHILTSPVCAWILFTASTWIWHVRFLYEAALQNGATHTLEHLDFLLTAMLFWWVLFKPTGQKHLHYGMAVAYLFTTTLQSGIFGALMTFTIRPWYPYYATFVSSWGLTPLQDQQFAGIIMWMPGGVVFTLLTIGYFAAWLRALEQRSDRSQRHYSLATHQETK